MSVYFDDDAADEFDEPQRCPECGRYMTRREDAEQGSCNDCWKGPGWE